MRIVNEFRSLPPMFGWYVERSLAWISPLDLLGIGEIRLIRKIPIENIHISPAIRDRYVGSGVNAAAYSPKNENGDASILLSVEDTYFPIPHIAYFSPIPILYIASIIGHEVGHHLIATRGFVFTPNERFGDYYRSPGIEEEFANRYAFDVVSKMKLRPTFKFAQWAMHTFSDVYYGLATAQCRNSDFRKAAKSWHKCWLLNRERHEALQWFWQTRATWLESSKSMK